MTQKFVLHAGDARRSQILANALDFLGKLPAAISWQIEIKQHTKERTDQQRKALYGVAYPILRDATGQDVEDWHTYMLGEWFGWIEYELFGKKKLKPARTTTTDFEGRPNKLTTVEFAEFYAFIQMRAAQYGIFVPDPDPLHKETEAA